MLLVPVLSLGVGAKMVFSLDLHDLAGFAIFYMGMILLF
jgi:hypothetical protein